jgi:hypothetical protein
MVAGLGNAENRDRELAFGFCPPDGDAEVWIMVDAVASRSVVDLRLHVTAEVFEARDVKHVSDLHVLERVFDFFGARRFGIADYFERHGIPARC